MRILVDECLPRQLRYWLERIGDFEVSTVQDEGWANVKNGKLLRAANDAGFDGLGRRWSWTWDPMQVFGT